MFQLYDQTFGPTKSAPLIAPAKAMLWAAEFVHAHGFGPSDTEVIREFAKVCRDGGDWMIFGGYVVKIIAGMPVQLDFETELTAGTLTIPQCGDLAGEFRSIADNPLGTYMGMGNEIIHEEIQSQAIAETTQAKLDRLKADWAPLVAHLDFVGLDSYLLGAPWVGRDLLYVEYQLPQFRKLFPNVQVLAEVTGQFTDTDKRKLTDNECAGVLGAIAAYDGAIVWGDYAMCDHLLALAIRKFAPVPPPTRGAFAP